MSLSLLPNLIPQLQCCLIEGFTTESAFHSQLQCWSFLSLLPNSISEWNSVLPHLWIQHSVSSFESQLAAQPYLSDCCLPCALPLSELSCISLSAAKFMHQHSVSFHVSVPVLPNLRIQHWLSNLMQIYHLNEWQVLYDAYMAFAQANELSQRNAPSEYSFFLQKNVQLKVILQYMYFKH